MREVTVGRGRIEGGRIFFVGEGSGEDDLVS
jgi:hypothetical protein